MDLKLIKVTILVNDLPFTLYTNLDKAAITAASEAWVKWTQIHTIESLCNFINMQRLKGEGCIAISEERWTEMLHEIKNQKDE